MMTVNVVFYCFSFYFIPMLNMASLENNWSCCDGNKLLRPARNSCLFECKSVVFPKYVTGTGARD